MRYPGGGQLAVVKSEKFPDVVLWNLGEAKAPTMADLGAGEWRQYACLEAGCIANPVSLAAGESFEAEQAFAVEEAPACEASS